MGKKKPKHGQGLMDTGIPVQPSKKELIAKIKSISVVPKGEGTGYITKIDGQSTAKFTESLEGLATADHWAKVKGVSLPKPTEFKSAHIEAKFYGPDAHKALQSWDTAKSEDIIKALKAANTTMEEWSKKAAALADQMAVAAAKAAYIVVEADGTDPKFAKGTIGYLFPEAPIPDGWKKAEDQNLTISAGTHWGGGHVDGSDTTAILEEAIPGFNQMKVKHPVHGDEEYLRTTIINLNDSHRWTREQIADWLETLDHDLTIRTESREEATR